MLVFFIARKYRYRLPLRCPPPQIPGRAQIHIHKIFYNSDDLEALLLALVDTPTHRTYSIGRCPVQHILNPDINDLKV